VCMVPRLRPHYSLNHYHRFSLNKTNVTGNASFLYWKGRKSSARFSSSSINSPPPPKPVQESKERSGHANWYKDMLPGMLPIFLVAFSVYGVSNMSCVYDMAGKPSFLDHVFSQPRRLLLTWSGI
jgi:hypothetical protein